MSTCNGSGWCQLWGWPELPLYTVLQSLFLQLSWKSESTHWYSWDELSLSGYWLPLSKKEYVDTAYSMNLLIVFDSWSVMLHFSFEGLILLSTLCFQPLQLNLKWFFFKAIIYYFYIFVPFYYFFYKSCNISKHLVSHKIYHQMAEHFLIGFSSFFLLRTCVCVCTQVQYEQVDCVRTQEP